MPRFDGTGPQSDGAMTGRKMGKCAGNSATTERPRGFGRRLPGEGCPKPMRNGRGRRMVKQGEGFGQFGRGRRRSWIHAGM